MKTFAVAALKPGTYVTGNLYLDGSYILLTPQIPLGEDLLKRLGEWGFREIQADDHSEFKATGLEDLPEGEVTSAFLSDSSDEAQSKEEVQRFYVSMLEFTHKLLELFMKKGQLPVEPVTELIKSLINLFRTHRRYLLRISELDRNGFPYLICHSVNTAILSVAIGESLKLPNHRVIELGLAGLLHEIGMYKLPDSFQNASRTLTPEEKRALTAHPILGYRALKEAGFPPNVTIAVLEHHEKEDGSGYPQALKGDKIPVASKILAVASAYDALITERPFREAHSGHSTLVDMLKEMGKAWDDQVLRRLIFTLGLFPIGTYVELKNGAIAQVHDANPENPKQPDVRLLTDETKVPLSDAPLLRLAEKPELTVAKVLNNAEVRQYKADRVLPA